MYFKNVVGSLFVAALSLGMANAALIEEVEVSPEGAEKFGVYPMAAREFGMTPKIIDMDGKKVFTTPPKGPLYIYYLKQKIQVDPAKKYQVSARIKQLGEAPALVLIGFIPYDDKGRNIGFAQGAKNTKGSFTALTASVAEGAESITVKDASKWEKGANYFVAFNAKEDMSDIPNFDVVGIITKIEKTDDAYTISLDKPIKKTYPVGTNVRQHRSGGTYVYTKEGKAPKEWDVWKGAQVQGEVLRKATYLCPMIMINANKEGSGAVFTDFVVEEF